MRPFRFFHTEIKTPNSKLRIGLPIFSGILLILCQPPVSLFPLAFVALIPLIYSLKQYTYRRPFFPGFITGIVSYLGLIYWVVVAMHNYGGIDLFTSTLILVLFVVYLSLYSGVFSAAISLMERKLAVPVYLSAPIAWVLLEYLRGTALTGFPWSYLAHSQHNFLPFIQIASITGTYFLSFLIVAINCLIFFTAARRPVSRVYVIAVCIMVAVCLGYGFMRLRGSQDGNLSTAIIQGNIRQDVKWDEGFKARTIETYYQNTINGGRDADIVIWPETAMPFVFNAERDANRYVKRLPSRVNSDLLFGTIWKDRNERFYNSAYVLGRDGNVNGIYNKVHLVPFGEYTPLARYLPFLEKITAQGAGFASGDDYYPISTVIGKVGILICYEGVFPHITNTAVLKGAQFLVNLTNDAWYERTSAAFQHLSFYVFRAVETDRYVLRAANTGISAIIDPRGHITARTPLFEEHVLRGNFGIRNNRTVYVRYGDYFILLAWLFLAVLIAVQSMRNRKP